MTGRQARERINQCCEDAKVGRSRGRCGAEAIFQREGIDYHIGSCAGRARTVIVPPAAQLEAVTELGEHGGRGLSEPRCVVVPAGRKVLREPWPALPARTNLRGVPLSSACLPRTAQEEGPPRIRRR
jgi:hypothetical protein